jgi:protein-S-isoprenylcysteine O-methyltransferase Ste14
MTHGHKHREAFQHRTDLTGEHAVSDIGQLVLACLFAATWIADSFFLKYTTFLNDHVSLAIRIPLAVVLLGVSAYLAWTGLSMVFGETREEPGVIRTGVFGIIRHPIYLSEVLLYLGLLMLSLLHYISRWEEKLLLARFGEEYAQYMRDVPMWIPRLGKR